MHSIVRSLLVLVVYLVAGLAQTTQGLISGRLVNSVTGKSIAGADVGSPRSPSQARLGFALGMCALGVILSLKALRIAGGIPAALAGAAGAIALLSFKTMSDDEVLRQGHGVIRVQYEFGYYLAVGALALAAVAEFGNRVISSISRRRD